MEKQCVFCEVCRESSDIIHVDFVLRRCNGRARSPYAIQSFAKNLDEVSVLSTVNKQ